jgi:hypothetical protein
MLTNEFYLGIIFCLGAVMALLALIFSIVALVKAFAVEKATHSVHMVPMDPEIEAANKKFMEEWATTDDAIKTQNEAYKEDLLKEMPDLAQPEEEIYSF